MSVNVHFIKGDIFTKENILRCQEADFSDVEKCMCS